MKVQSIGKDVYEQSALFLALATDEREKIQ
jgi:hypothetical protein